MHRRRVRGRFDIGVKRGRRESKEGWEAYDEKKMKDTRA